MQCPKCEAVVQNAPVECPKCGIIFKKYENSKSERIARLPNDFDYSEESTSLLRPEIDVLLPVVAIASSIAIKWIFPKLVWALSMWVHELGHATTAWFGGVAATPFLGWTSMDLDRTWTVTICFTTLLVLLGYKSWQYKSYFLVTTMFCAFVAQIYFRFFLRQEQLDFMFSYMGIGGEFWISSWFLIAYHYRFPEYVKWNILKYPVMWVGAIVFWDTFAMWRGISKGYVDFPWGSVWGGEDVGDMNTLRDEFGWQTLVITNSYVRFGTICLTILILHYICQIIRTIVKTKDNKMVGKSQSYNKTTTSM